MKHKNSYRKMKMIINELKREDIQVANLARLY